MMSVDLLSLRRDSGSSSARNVGRTWHERRRSPDSAPAKAEKRSTTIEDEEETNNKKTLNPKP